MTGAEFVLLLVLAHLVRLVLLWINKHIPEG